jgi:peptidoglycan/xylan/chitin deacetylase (PgdA/CDA1 family)
MARMLTIVMYHYVRDAIHTQYPRIKARSIAEFQSQLRYARRHHAVVTMEEVLHAIRCPDAALPERPILLTFDDGYVDHYETVFPLLAQEGLQGSFFPPAKPIVDGCVLDVNKLHFVLARSTDTRNIVNAIFDAVDSHSAEFGLDEAQAYWNRLAIANRFDGGDVVFIKRMLQRELPEELRSAVLGGLFCSLVDSSETAFARQLYMTPEQIRRMSRAGMFIGSHGSSHYWMDRLNPEQQEAEIDAGIDFLKALDCLRTHWVMCYPYGAWNAPLLAALHKRNCAAGLTTEVAIADLDRNPLTLPRVDTNDLPVTH